MAVSAIAAMLISYFESRITREGCLEFPMSAFGNTVARITPWTDGFDTFEIKYKKVVKKPLWALEIFPRHQLTLTLGTDANRFLSEIPAEIRKRIQSYKFGQCAMLRWLARYPEAGDLFDSNPKLLWLLTTAVFDSSVDEDELACLLRKKQVEILGRIFKPPSPSALRFLQKVELVAGDLIEARTIIRTLKKPHIRRIVAHLQAVSTTLLRTLYDNPDLAMPSVAKFLTEEFRNPDCNPRMLSLHVSDTIRDIRRMAEVLGIQDPGGTITRCQSLQGLNRLHDRWVDRVNRHQGLLLGDGQGNWLHDLDYPDQFEQQRVKIEQLDDQDWIFPEPPFPENKEIKAIRSISELVAEGRLQRNCVASYASEIVNGEVFVYKVLKPHRATLELINKDAGWEPGQLKLSCNRAPGPEVERVVNEWIAANK
jgi:hypothetical protein